MKENGKNTGFSLVEILITVGVIGLLLTVLVLALNSKQKEIRDIKRINDIQTLRNALEVVKNQGGNYERAYCDLGIISQCAGKSNSELAKYILNLKALNDPQEQIVSCAKQDVCQARSCNYTLTKLETDDYEIKFYLEKGIDDLLGEGCYLATPTGIRKL